MPVINRTPYRNLILTGTIGVGKTGAGRLITQRLSGADFIDLETEIEQREGYTAEQMREIFGIARLRGVESQLIQEVTLRRSTVISVSGATLLDQKNLESLAETGPVLCLKAALGEILRRLHVTRGGWFHNPQNRAAIIAKLQREKLVLDLDLPKLDTTGLKLEEVAQQATDFWIANADT